MDYYFYAGGSGGSMDVLANWWADGEHQTQASELPGSGDTAYFYDTASGGTCAAIAVFNQLGAGISGGTFSQIVNNTCYSRISGGTFADTVLTTGEVTGGAFCRLVLGDGGSIPSGSALTVSDYLTIADASLTLYAATSPQLAASADIKSTATNLGVPGQLDLTNLVAGNIKDDVTIGGVLGTLKSTTSIAAVRKAITDNTGDPAAMQAALAALYGA